MKITLSNMGSTLDIIHNRGANLEKEFQKSKILNFHEKYVKGEKVGEGQHTTVWVCYERSIPRPENDCTPLCARDISPQAYKPTKYAVKIVRDDDNEKLSAHEREYTILS